MEDVSFVLRQGENGPWLDKVVNQSECQLCPEWVMKCVHFDGLWLALHHNIASDYVHICIGADPPQWEEADSHIGKYILCPDTPEAMDIEDADSVFDQQNEKLLEGGFDWHKGIWSSM